MSEKHQEQMNSRSNQHRLHKKQCHYRNLFNLQEVIGKRYKTMNANKKEETSMLKTRNIYIEVITT